MKLGTVILLSLSLLATACGNTKGERGLSGAGIGAGIGAVGAAVVGGSVVTGAVVGGAVGAATGVVVRLREASTITRTIGPTTKRRTAKTTINNPRGATCAACMGYLPA